MESPVIETIILEEPAARNRFRTAPCLEEREQFLSHLLRRGLGHSRLRSISGYMLQIVRLMGLTTFRTPDSTTLRTLRKSGTPIEDWIAEESQENRHAP